MIEIQFGDKFIETDLGKIELEDLANSKAGEVSTLILQALKEDMISSMRAAIRTGNDRESAKCDGYLECLEHIETFYKVHLPEVLKSQESD